MKNVLIVFGTRFGGTTRIATHIASGLKKNGVNVVVHDVDDLKKDNDVLNEQEFDAIIIGSGIQVGKWTSKMRKFIEKYKEELNKANLLAMFVSCGTANSEKGIQEAINNYITEFANHHGLHPDIIAAFGGVYDFSSKSRISKVKQAMIKAVIKNNEDISKYNLKGVNDFRDWNLIDKFTNQVLEQV
ncbi:MAG: flavodoxin domain-containing protein [Promethearchaeota archaeon]